MDRVFIFDTTLRDGEQASGAALNIDEKLEIAKRLERLKVDIIEAGFPISSPGDMEAVRKISQVIRDPIVCALAHANPRAIDTAAEALEEARYPRIHVFLSSSEIHMSHQLKKDKNEVLKLTNDMVSRAKKHVKDVEFSPMDATRTEPEFLHQIVEVAINAGATTVNIPDTVGYTIPSEFCRLIDSIFENVPNIHNAIVSVHCHNDLGLAVANSLAVLDHGVRQIECTVNGIGERAGNAAVEEIVMAMRTRKDLFDYVTSIDIAQILKTSRLVSERTGMRVQPNKAIVGANAFRHESGIHQDGILKERSTYEIMDPKSIGLKGSMLTLGKLSGRHAFNSHIKEMGYELTDDELKRVFSAFKALADKKKDITDRDLEALIEEELRTVSEVYSLDHVQVTCGDHSVPTASIRLIGPDGNAIADASLGTGPVDAIYKAVNRVVKVPNELIEFSVQSVTKGIDAIGEVTIRIQNEGKTYTGRGADTDIMVASTKAYLNALNRLLSAMDKSQH